MVLVDRRNVALFVGGTIAAWAIIRALDVFVLDLDDGDRQRQRRRR